MTDKPKEGTSTKVEETFEPNEIVWAKVRGYSWWPAVVGKICKKLKSKPETLYEVHFIGDLTRAQLYG